MERISVWPINNLRWSNTATMLWGTTTRKDWVSGPSAYRMPDMGKDKIDVLIYFRTFLIMNLRKVCIYNFSTFSGIACCQICYHSVIFYSAAYLLVSLTDSRQLQMIS